MKNRIFVILECSMPVVMETEKLNFLYGQEVLN